MGLAANPLPRQRSATYLRAMASKATNLEIGSIRTVKKGDGVVRTGASTGVPTRFTAYITLTRPALEVALDVRVPLNNPAQVRKVTVTPLGEPSITAGAFRSVALEHLLREALRNAEVQIEPRGDIGSDAFQVPGDSPGTYRIGDMGTSRTQKSDDFVVRAAVIYKEALMQGSGAPAEAVAKELDRSRGQAARYIRRARELGLLPPRGSASDDDR